MQFSTAWQVISFAHRRSFKICAVKYMISDDHALILYDHERSIATFHPRAWDIIVKVDALGSIDVFYSANQIQGEINERQIDAD